MDRAAVERKVGDKVIYDLTHKRFSELTRPQHAPVYASIQGRTLQNLICLMDLKNPKMTVRDIITAMSRPTRQSDLKVMSGGKQRSLMENIYERIENNQFDLRARAAEVTVRSSVPSERRTPSRVGR